MGYRATNNAVSVLAASMAATAGATTVEIDPADVPLFPVINNGGVGSDYTLLTIVNNARDLEIVKVTRHDSGSSVFTVVRGWENTSILAWDVGDLVSSRLTAGVVEEAFLHVDDVTNAHMAIAIGFNPTGTIGATTVQEAVAEVSGDVTVLYTVKADADHDHDGVYEPVDINIARLNMDQNWTGSQRATYVTDNDGSFDMSAGTDFVCTAASSLTLQFANEAAGQRGCILLNNAGAFTISLGAEIDAPADMAVDLSAAGKYWLSYWCYDGTNVALVASGALA